MLAHRHDVAQFAAPSPLGVVALDYMLSTLPTSAGVSKARGNSEAPPAQG